MKKSIKKIMALALALTMGLSLTAMRRGKGWRGCQGNRSAGE